MKKLRIVLIVVLLIGGLVAGGLFLREELNMRKSEKEFQELSNLIKNGEEGEEFVTPGEKYSQVIAKNKDIIGWIRIDGTKIDYPVVSTPGEKETYIHMNLEGEYAFSGTLFTDGHNIIKEDERSDNIIIYGHNMKNDSMFGTLDYYADKSFFEEHKTFTFDTIYEFGEYEVLAVFRGDVLKQADEGFRYYNFIDADSPEDYDEFIANVKERSLYETGVTAEYGDKLVTLVTCIRNEDDKRFVVVAKMVDR